MLCFCTLYHRHKLHKWCSSFTAPTVVQGWSNNQCLSSTSCTAHWPVGSQNKTKKNLNNKNTNFMFGWTFWALNKPHFLSFVLNFWLHFYLYSFSPLMTIVCRKTEATFLPQRVICHSPFYPLYLFNKIMKDFWVLYSEEKGRTSCPKGLHLFAITTVLIEACWSNITAGDITLNL